MKSLENYNFTFTRRRAAHWKTVEMTITISIYSSYYKVYKRMTFFRYKSLLEISKRDEFDIQVFIINFT